MPLLLSLFIYLEYFGLSLKLINTIIALSAFLLIFQLNKKELFLSGFIIGILWFWWLGYSFVYYELSFMIPIVIIGIGLLYGLFFYLIGLINNIYYKISYIFLLSYIEPFSFNWFKIELPFINSYLGTSKLEFLAILIISALFIEYRYKYKKIIPISYAIVIIVLFFTNKYNTSQNNIKYPPIKIYKYKTNIPQEKKWDRKYKKEIIENNIGIKEMIIKVDRKKGKLVSILRGPDFLSFGKTIRRREYHFSRKGFRIERYPFHISSATATKPYYNGYDELLSAVGM